jgi:hypothetical protein
MKGRFVAFVGIFCIAILIVSAANADKPPKPPKPDKTTAECITFTGDLIGHQQVEGCCPNAGPFPQYAMTLNFAVAGFPAGSYFDGQLFINNYGSGRDRKYKVQFWSDHDGPDHIAIEIIGGEIYADKKTKTLTVVFTDEDCVDLHTKEFIAKVSFTLVRTPN